MKKKNFSNGELIRLGTFMDDVLCGVLDREIRDLMTLEKNKALIFSQKMIKNVGIAALKNSVLFIRAASSVWRAEIYAKKAEIIENSNEILGKNTIQDIRLI